MRGLLVLAALAACEEPPLPALAMTSNPLAVGATARGHLDDLGAATVEPPELFALSVAGDDLTLVATAPGTGTLRVQTRDGFELQRVVTALAIDGVTVTPALRNEPCESPALFTVGTRASVPVTLYGGGTPLNGEIVPPVMASAGTIDPDTSVDGTLELRLPDTPGTVQLSAVVDPSLDVTLAMIEPTVVDALLLGEPDGRLFPTSVVTIAIDLLAGGRTLCGDTLSRTVVIDTPETCKLDGGEVQVTAPSLSELRVRGHHAGACTVRLTVDGTALGATKTLAVSM